MLIAVVLSVLAFLVLLFNAGVSISSTTGAIIIAFIVYFISVKLIKERRE
ncbi:hypothetical protein [Bacillus sp. JCM 19041]